MIILYGITNCDAVKKARRWLKANDIDYHFHDFRKHGLDAQRLETWVEKLGGWETLMNRRSAAWRGLKKIERSKVDLDKAITLMLRHHNLIKRPVLETDEVLLVGFCEEDYEGLFEIET